ncbi:hypothetical protein EYZ11_002988 [Aspergillus tanneri]|uniref:Myb-like domain-containing protein n=1 Tax=Aspergillus tanneri TaxID=1220188 RepID=A0A4S3JPP3_9EURO|nr:uncharacterized protein ATNIH1004_000898 [Aspergillus tanneri]KAA8651998.1 hypothetical protein ATNIH1004_000898 [Aspergillus tanneri]THC97565.1 hypothetical protein EYZ11_002988 [Aspergillus tanneri]
MPVFLVNGRRYRVRFWSLLNGSEPISEDPPSARKRTKATWEDVAADRTWTAEEDRLLRELKNCHIPWKYVTVAMGNRPAAQLKRRWYYLRNRKSNETETADLADQSDDEHSWEDTEEVERPQRRVSFASPLVTMREDDAGEDEDYVPRAPRIKKVCYIDSDLNLKEILLLHKIAAKWERDRWLAISTRFNDKTGRSITPEQAKWIIDN